MNSNASLFIRILALVSSGLILSSTAWGNSPSPTSKLYVADLEGQSEIDTGERIEDIQNKSVHNAQGTIIVTLPDSANSMVFSNGTGVFLQEDSRLEVKRFSQEPFVPNRTDLESEPSISQTLARLSHGMVGLCTPKMVAGSSMVYGTPQASVNVRGGKVVIQSDEYTTTVSSIEGSVTISGTGGSSRGLEVTSGNQAVITRMPGRAPSIDIQPIPDADSDRLSDSVAMACSARKIAYEDALATNGDDAGLGSIFIGGETPDGGSGNSGGDTGGSSGDGGDGPTEVSPPDEVIGSPSSITT